MRKSLFRTAMTLLAAAMTIVVLFACSPTGNTKMIGLAILKNGQAVTEISITEGNKIDYDSYSLLISVSDGSAFTADLTENSFSKTELDELYALPGGGAKTMNLYFLSEGQTAQGIIVVNVLTPVVEKQTYTLRFVLTGDFADYRFDPIPNLSRVTSLPETHPELQNYQKITWYRVKNDISTRMDLPYELTSDTVVYGVVRDDRTYTVRFWKDKSSDGYKNQIGSDVSELHPGDRVDLPSSGIDKVGYEFYSWKKYDAQTGADAELSVYGEIGKKYFTIQKQEPCLSYPSVQIVNVYASYVVKRFTLSFFYADDQNQLNELKLDGSKNVFPVNYGTVLKLGDAFSQSETEFILPPAPAALGDAYRGSWYVNDTVFGGNQTRTVQNHIAVIVKYEKKRQVVRFLNDRGGELKSLTVDYGTVIDASEFPAHSVETGYAFSWDDPDALANPVTADFDVREVKTPNPYSYGFYLETAGGKLLYETADSPFNAPIALWDAGKIQTALGQDYKPYYDYGWYASEASDPETDPPLAGSVAQVAGRMSFYLKKRDMRRYTVDYYAQLSADGAIASERTATVTVGYAASATFAADPVPGWRADSVYDKTDPTARFSTDLTFVPSSFAAAGEAREYRLEVVVRYERERYNVRLSERFGRDQNLFTTVENVPYETLCGDLDAVKNYSTADRAEAGETFRFYGWFDAGGKAIAPETAKVVSDTDLYAHWIALSEGTLGLKYEVKNAGGSPYAEVVGYEGSAAELIVGSKYVAEGTAYPVEAVGLIVAGKNLSVTKITIPSSVKTIEPGAFANFYAVREYEAAADSAALKTDSGVLFTKDGTKIIAYPIKKEGGFAAPDAVTAIGNSAFMGFGGSSVTFGASSALSEIGDNAFANASALSSIALPSALTRIGAGAFQNANRLATVTYAGTLLARVGENAFAGTQFDKNDADGIVTLGTVLITAKGNVSPNFVLDDAVQSIADGAFKGNTTIVTFTVGEGSALRYVGAGAFANCQQLNAFVVRKTSAILEFDRGAYAFNGVSPAFAIAVPAEKLSEYNATYSDSDYNGDFKAI